jgi:hypothetical protein
VNGRQKQKYIDSTTVPDMVTCRVVRVGSSALLLYITDAMTRAYSAMLATPVIVSVCALPAWLGTLTTDTELEVTEAVICSEASSMVWADSTTVAPTEGKL